MRPQELFPREITITEEHIALLRAACIDWCDSEFGAPSIDPKRPYGADDVLRSIARIVGMPLPDLDKDEDFTKEQEARLRRLHTEVATALQILLATFQLKPGHYAFSDGEGWRRAKQR